MTFLQRSTNMAGTTLAADSSCDIDELARLACRHDDGSMNHFQIAAYAMACGAANRIVRIDSSVGEASLDSCDLTVPAEGVRRMRVFWQDTMRAAVTP